MYILVATAMTNPEPEETKPALVTIRIFTGESEAMIAKSVLEAAGIDCMISCDDCAGYQPTLSIVNGIRLVVRSDDSALAEKVLTEAQDSN